MYYQTQDRKTFEKQLDEYLASNPTHLVYERNKINSFSSNNLSDLYKLFLDLEGHKLDEELFTKFEEIIRNCSVEPNQILMSNANFPNEYIVSAQNTAILTNIIKEKVLDYINNPEDQFSSSIDKEEFSRLYVIVNKLFPDIFVNDKPLIENEFVQQTLRKTLEIWKSHNKKTLDSNLDPKEMNRDILGGIYIATKKLYPKLNIYLPARIKSPSSSVNNIIKEINNSFSSLVPSDPSKGISDEDIQDQFNLSEANKDFTGFTFVLSNTDDALELEPNHPKYEESVELQKLVKLQEQSGEFYHDLKKFLNAHDRDSTSLSNIQLLQIKIELLEKLRTLTYEECTKEYNGTSFTQLLDESITTYKKVSNNSEIFYEDDIYDEKIDEIYELLDELENRRSDKYYAYILKMTLSDILNHKILKEDIGVKFRFVKSVKKENGFCADYYELESPDNRKIELQVITKYRFKESKSGSSSHTKLSGKSINISQFFEASSDNITPEDFQEYLQLLNSTSIGERNLLYSKNIEDMSRAERRKKQRLQLAEQSVKLRNSINIESTQELDPTILREIFPEEIKEDGVLMDMDVYLPIFASYVSPDMSSVGSHHTRFNEDTASYHEISGTSAFKEVLLRDDQISCLSQMLIDRLELLLPNVKSEITLNGILKRHSNNASTKNSITSENEKHKEISTPSENKKRKEIFTPSVGNTTRYYRSIKDIPIDEMFDNIIKKYKGQQQNNSPSLSDNPNDGR